MPTSHVWRLESWKKKKKKKKSMTASIIKIHYASWKNQAFVLTAQIMV